METASQTISRLLGALENLTREEHLLLAQGNFPEAIAVQERERPLVAKIAEMLFQPGVIASLSPTIQTRVQALLSAQNEQSLVLAARINETREQLGELRAAQSRAEQILPAYGQPRRAQVSMSFAGEG